jgi:hypothetical protein
MRCQKIREIGNFQMHGARAIVDSNPKKPTTFNTLLGIASNADIANNGLCTEQEAIQGYCYKASHRPSGIPQQGRARGILPPCSPSNKIVGVD